MSYNKEIVEYRIANHLCTQCGDKSRDGYKTCEKCAIDARQRVKKHREKHKAVGLCVDCSDKSIPGSQYCQKHKDVQHISQRRRDREWRLQKTNIGLCSDCGKNESIPGKKLCEQCRDAYNNRLVKWRTKKLSDGLCSRCGKYPIVSGLKQCKECTAKRKQKDLLIKRQVLDAYGNKCICCDETEIDFLAIDHINNDGYKSKRNGRTIGGISFYRQIIKEGFPSNLQILCHNCNWSKHINNGKCIHQIKSILTDGDLSREICKICHNINTVGFDVPNEIWRNVVPIDKQNSVVCLSCFTRLGDQKNIRWDKDIEFFSS